MTPKGPVIFALHAADDTDDPRVAAPPCPDGTARIPEANVGVLALEFLTVIGIFVIVEYRDPSLP